MTRDASTGGHLGFESNLWRAADALRSNMDAAEYKHVVLGLIFLKYISDSFEEQHAKLEAESRGRRGRRDVRVAIALGRQQITVSSCNGCRVRGKQ